MSKKGIGMPDSDQTARKNYEPEEEPLQDPGDLAGRQTSNKSGKHSSVEKLAASRSEFGSAPGGHPVPGAFGKTDDDVATPETASAPPRPQEFRCDSCGRTFSSSRDLADHEIECRLAKEATRHPQS